MRFARYTFAIAGIYGLLVLVPQYFLIDKIGADNPPVVTHPEYFYGFVGVAVAFQLVFLVIATDPVRYRPLMLAAVIEKLIFVVPTSLLYVSGRVAGPIVSGAAMDLVLAVFFAISFVVTPRTDRALGALR